MTRPLALTAYLALARLSEPLWRAALSRRVVRGREDPARLPEKLGHGMAPRPEGRVIWLHALSVGEALALMSLMRRLGAALPDAHLLLTTSTRASAEALDKVGLPPRVIHQYAPVDAPGPLQRFLAHWRPEVAVFAEFDMWPLRIETVAQAGIPMILINSRVSERRFRRRRRASAIYGHLLARFERVLLQDAASVSRFVALGAPPDRIAVMGVLKSAADPLPDDPAERGALAAAMGERPRWLAASTDRREEPHVLRAHALARQVCPDLLLIITPRQMKHADETEAAARAAVAHVARRSRGEMPDGRTEVYIADTLGEMGLWYRLCPVAFIGHSMPVPAPALTGKNPFEAAVLGAMVIHGPDTGNFAESYAALQAEGGAVVVEDAADLARTIVAAQDDATRAPIVAGAAQVVAAGQAPLEIALREVLALLGETI